MRNVHTREYRAMLAKLIAARQKRRLTQVEVAAALGIPQDRISRMETGERRIDALELNAFAKLYRRKLEWFVSP